MQKRLDFGFLKFFTALVILICAFGSSGFAQGNATGKYRNSLDLPSQDAPTCLKPSSGLVVTCYEGSVYFGAGAVPAGSSAGVTLTATDSKNSCPTDGSCNFIYSDNSGTLHITTSKSTAFTSTTAPLYYVSTTGGNVVGVQFWQRNTTHLTLSEAVGAGQPVLSEQPIIAAAATLSPTVAQSGSLILMGATTGEVITLPAPVAGTWYDVVVTVSNTSASNEIETNAGTVFLLGMVEHSATGIAPLAFWANGTSTEAIKMNGGTTGGLIGSHFRLKCISSTQWEISGDNLGTATMTTALTGTP